MDTMDELKEDAYETEQDANRERCHECGKTDRKTDLVRCAHLRCSRSVCCDCASELEWELETCREHALANYRDVVAMHRNALRRALSGEYGGEYGERRAA